LKKVEGLQAELMESIEREEPQLSAWTLDSSTELAADPAQTVDRPGRELYSAQICRQVLPSTEAEEDLIPTRQADDR
jgi:hypothetical protein